MFGNIDQSISINKWNKDNFGALEIFLDNNDKKNIDFIFMAAANTSGAAVMEKTPLTHLTPNVVMNSQILSAAYENNVSKFCFISSNTPSYS
mgnify:CR=1 FL=1